MPNHSSIIVNHKVALPGTSSHGAIATHRLDYIRTRLGTVREATLDDIHRQETQDALGYIAHRKGAVAEEGTNCALFNASGIANYSLTKRDLMAAQGAILTSVVTVRREDAEELRLQTKQDFQRFLRANWLEHLEQLGIAPHDARWVAAFHTNSNENFHVHVISWDASGRFDNLIPKKTLEHARENLVHKALTPSQQRLSNVRTQTRDDLIQHIRKDELEEVHYAEACNIAQSLPVTGSLKYGSLINTNPELKQKIDSLVQSCIESSPGLKKKLEKHRQAVDSQASLQGLEGRALHIYKNAAMDDLKTRLGNAQLKQIKQLAGITNAPKQRTTAKIDLFEGNRVVSPRDRTRERVIAQELNACLMNFEKVKLAQSFKAGNAMPKKLSEKVSQLPSVKQYSKSTYKNSSSLSSNIARSITQLSSDFQRIGDKAMGKSRSDTGDEAGEQSVLATRIVAAQVLRAIRIPIIQAAHVSSQKLKTAIHIKR